MADTRQPLFTVQTPYSGAQTVVCWQDTWLFHVDATRRDLGHQVVIGTLEAPSVILQGTTNPGYLVYLNESFISPGHQSPFAVIVDPQANPLAAVASFGFRRDFKNLTGQTIVWTPPGNIDPTRK